ncbi:MAG: hypothetical protein P4L68_09870 [Methylovirgula sp.]|nr:hypothetical protein [Methylovirgula sp.]
MTFIHHPKILTAQEETTKKRRRRQELAFFEPRAFKDVPGKVTFAEIVPFAKTQNSSVKAALRE